MAKIIVIEGPDKVGKETQSKLLLQALADLGKRVIRVEVPTKAAPRTYKLIYWMLKNGWAKRLPNVFQFIQFLNKWFFQRNVLPRLSKDLDYIIFDRWSLSALVYGSATGVNEPLNFWLYNKLRKADTTIVMCEKSFRRSSTQDDSYERDSDLQAKVRNGYRVWAEMNPLDHVLINNEQPVEDVHQDVLIKLAMFGIP